MYEINNAISQLEKKLRNTIVSERKNLLEGVYKQLAVSNKGKQANGQYRLALNLDPLNAPLLVHYVLSQLQKNGMDNHANKLYLQYVSNVGSNRISGNSHMISSVTDLGKDLNGRNGYLAELKIPFESEPTKDDVIAVSQALAVFINNRSPRRQQLDDSGATNRYNNPGLDSWCVLIDEFPESSGALYGTSYAVIGNGQLGTSPNAIYIHGHWPGQHSRAGHPLNTLEQFAETLRVV
jgi:hypothetical protein